MAGATPIHAIIPAAGRSRRMGRSKQLVRVGGVPLLLRTVRTIFAGGVERLVVVVHADIERRLGAELRAAGAVLERNDDAASEMIDSVRIGLRRIAREPIGDADGLLVCPADMPALTAADVRACVDAFGEQPDRIVVAAWRGRHGHPLILPASLADEVFSPGCDAGLRALLRLYRRRLRPVECPTAGVLADADRPDELPGDA